MTEGNPVSKKTKKTPPGKQRLPTCEHHTLPENFTESYPMLSFLYTLLYMTLPKGLRLKVLRNTAGTKETKIQRIFSNDLLLFRLNPLFEFQLSHIYKGLWGFFLLRGGALGLWKAIKVRVPAQGTPSHPHSHTSLLVINHRFLDQCNQY